MSPRFSPSPRLLPPRKRDWKKGTPQVGVFLRTEDGGTMEMVHDQATKDETLVVVALLRGLVHLPNDVVRPLREHMAALLAEAKKTP